MTPKVSVLMSVYNGETYLRQAIESILGQTFGDFEFIIVDDGSTDRSPAILAEYADQDDRIRLLENDSNLGLIASLNKGIRFARGDYVARQDADDVSLSGRFESQVAFLDRHPEIGVLGTWMMNVDRDGFSRIWKTPARHHVICWALLFNTSVAHATVMMRRYLLDEDMHYRPEMLHCEDHDLWSRLSKKTKMANLPICLYLRRVHERRVSVLYSFTQHETTKRIIQSNTEELLGTEVGETLASGLWEVVCGKRLRSRQELDEVVSLHMRLYAEFLAKNVLDEACRKEVASDLARRLARLGLNHFRQRPKQAIRILRKAFGLSPRDSFHIHLSEALKLIKAHV